MTELVQDDERRLPAARTTALALREAGRYDDAQDVLDAEVQRVRTPGVAIALLVEGTYMALERDQVDEAAERVKIALRVDAADASVAEAAFFVGEALFDAERTEEASGLYASAAVEGSPVAAQALYKQGFAHLRRDDPAGAAASFARLVAEHPDDELRGEALFLLGEARYRTGDFEAAVAPLEELRKSAPRHEVIPKALFRLGLSLGELGRWRETESVLADLAKRFPRFENLAEAELWRGRALAGLGDRRSARLAFERVVAMDKGVLAARARIGLGELELAAGAHEEALSQFLKVAVLYAHSEEVAEALVLAGDCLVAMGDDDRAREQYREVLSSHPDTKAAKAARQKLSSL